MEIRRLFPDCYVALDKYKIKDGKSSGVLIYVCKTQKELNPILLEYANKCIKLSCTYTSEQKGMIGYETCTDFIGGW